MKVQVASGGSTGTLATYFNLDEGPHAKRSVNLSAYTGRALTVKFLGVEDSSLPLCQHGVRRQLPDRRPSLSEG